MVNKLESSVDEQCLNQSCNEPDEAGVKVICFKFELICIDSGLSPE